METLIENQSGELLLQTTPKKSYNSGLRALLTIRNFSDVLEKHYARLTQIEEEINELNNKTKVTIEMHGTPELCLKWNTVLEEFSDSVRSVNQLINFFREKITIRDRSDTSTLWVEFDEKLDQLKKNYKALEIVGAEILPQNEQENWVCSEFCVKIVSWLVIERFSEHFLA